MFHYYVQDDEIEAPGIRSPPTRIPARSNDWGRGTPATVPDAELRGACPACGHVSLLPLMPCGKVGNHSPSVQFLKEKLQIGILKIHFSDF